MVQAPLNTFRQTNAFAMTYGLYLALWGFGALSLMTMSVANPVLSYLSVFMFYGSPVFAGVLTTRFRLRVTEVTDGFRFGRAFLFTFMMGVYASLIIGTLVYIYLAYFDTGIIWRGFEEMLSRPEMIEKLANYSVSEDFASLGIKNTPADIVAAMRSLPPSGYATMIIYMSLLVAPAISGVIALITRRQPQSKF